MPKEIIYYRHWKKYRKLQRHEVIEEGAMMSWCNGELYPIMNSDGKTIGSTPSQFSKERDFYNPIRCECGQHLVKDEVICENCELEFASYQYEVI